jgi:NAD(P)-dependent dehydrogenase (short-subunit alcohol dehydrogenase family)
MLGKTVLVTGATAGIGFHVARALAAKGARVIVTGRDEARGRAAVEQIRSRASGVAIEFLPASSALVSDNIRLASEVARLVEHLDVLVNNVGGCGPGKRTETSEGCEATMALNFVGPFALTTQLLPLLKRSPQPRVVTLSSSAFQMWKRDPFEELDARGGYIAIQACAHAKLLGLLFTLALARRERGVRVNAVNPGMAWTPGTQALTKEAVPAWRFIWPLVRWFQRRASPEAAARGPVYLASAPDAIFTGHYLEGIRTESLPAAVLDHATQDRAWELGEALIERALRGGAREISS